MLNLIKEKHFKEQKASFQGLSKLCLAEDWSDAEVASLIISQVK